MVAPLGRHSPCWGHHGEAPCPLPRGALRVKTLSIYGLAVAAPWRRTLLGGVVFGVPSRLVVVVVDVWSFCVKRAWFVLL
jgi:hypothetical protein